MTTTDLLARLPGHLSERLRVVSNGDLAAEGRHVVYWMHHAVRGHENPALDAARITAAELRAPLVVYQGLGGGHRFDNDRHHTFILEGARDVRTELADQAIDHVFWLGDEPIQPSPLLQLATDAALVVTEDFPAPPFPRWTARLADRIDVPVWAVDTACVVPMRLVGRAHDRAYAFRSAIRDELESRLHLPWPAVDAAPPRFDRTTLDFKDTDLEHAEIADLVARCAIDHTVGPVAHTPGGSIAGYERWDAFRHRWLRSYAARRNDAAGGGVSRLSAYLHHGHVSPLRIARETAESGGKGAEKFLDELIIWRELAHNLCFHRHELVESLDVLPEWARTTLERHADDDRDIQSWEMLARGRTGDRLWDLCQTSLVRHGELHNNVRMTWGKALIGWTPSPGAALATLIDLNHRFALDGSDPNSYGGLLWCLGLFDRPFEPERPVLGSVRPRSTASHTRRLDLDRYAARVTPPATERPLEVAVVGAGVSGLSCARVLADHGHRVRVFDKSRGPGGRMSTRRADEWRFDHGAQYFTARDPRFARIVRSWRDDGLVARWTGIIAVLDRGEIELKDDPTDRWVAVPGMNAVCRHLADDLAVRYEHRIVDLERDDDLWWLHSADGERSGPFDAVVVSAPAPQTAALLADAAPVLTERAGSAEMAPCWAVMAGFDDPLGLGFDGGFVHNSPLSWVSRNDSKPGRPSGESWVLHGSPEWSREHLELDTEIAAHRLADAFRDAVGRDLPQPDHLVAHRWRFALPAEPLPEPCLFDRELAIAACGDWAGGPRVEGAYLSGCAAAGRLLGLRPGPAQPSLFDDAG
jgi:photolyase PhrII